MARLFSLIGRVLSVEIWPSIYCCPTKTCKKLRENNFAQKVQGMNIPIFFLIGLLVLVAYYDKEEVKTCHVGLVQIRGLSVVFAQRISASF